MAKNQHSSPELASLASRVFEEPMDLDVLELELARGVRAFPTGTVLKLIHMAQDAKRLAGSVLTQGVDRPLLPFAVPSDP